MTTKGIVYNRTIASLTPDRCQKAIWEGLDSKAFLDKLNPERERGNTNRINEQRGQPPKLKPKAGDMARRAALKSTFKPAPWDNETDISGPNVPDFRDASQGSSDGIQASAFDQGIASAVDALESSLCRSFLSKSKSYPSNDPREVFDAYRQQGRIRVGSTYDSFGKQASFSSSDVGATTTLQWPTGGIILGARRIAASGITINASGFFFSLSASNGTPISFKNGFRGLGAFGIRGAVMIHEFAHAYGSIPDDGNNPGQSEANSVNIQSICFSGASRAFRDHNNVIEYSPTALLTTLSGRRLL